VIALLREFWLFLLEERKWWLVPILGVVGVVGLLVILGALFPAAAPFIYTIL
jgi:hypothetical protein